jgi:hypothetical protein
LNWSVGALHELEQVENVLVVLLLLLLLPQVDQFLLQVGLDPRVALAILMEALIMLVRIAVY